MTVLHFKPRVHRHAVALAGSTIDASGAHRDVRIENFSLDGCCLGSAYPIGARLTVLLPRMGSFSGQVRWSVLGKAGIRFDHGLGG